MKVLWICGLPNEVRLNGYKEVLSSCETPAWSWILGHLPPPSDVELHVLCPTVGLVRKHVEFEFCGAHWHCFDRKPFWKILATVNYLWRIKRFVRKLSPDIVHGWGGETGFGFAAAMLTKKAVVSVQGLLLLLRYGASAKFMKKKNSLRFARMMWREKQTYRRARVLLTESKAAQKSLQELYGFKSELVPHPLRHQFLESSLENRFSLVLQPPKFVFVGSLIDRKGAMDALVAFEKLRIAEARLIFVGSGPEQNQIERYVKGHLLDQVVLVRNSLSPDEIVKEFEDAQFFILPSYGDTGPTALKEAISSGLYPICYDNSGPRDLITHYGCGSLCKTGDMESLTENVDKCVRNMEDCVKMACEAATRVREELYPMAIWSKLIKIYEGVGI